MSLSLEESALRIREAIKLATEGLVEREVLADLLVLSAIAGEHLLVIGPPGTAKSAVVRRVARALGGRYFEYLLGRFTEPSEIFGPVDLRKLREGTVETQTAGMLPEAEVAFLDEIFLGSTAVLNTLLSILNERTFRRGHTQMACPLRVCAGASNALPEDPALAAFADRFLLHCFIDPVPECLLEAMLEGGWRAREDPEVQSGGLERLDALSQVAAQADMAGIVGLLAHSVRQLRKAGVELSDRRIVKTQGLIAAAAALAGRAAPTEQDLWPLIYIIPTREGQALGREALAATLAASSNAATAAAVEDASSSPDSRAARIAGWAEEALSAEPEAGADREQWELKLESVGREIDAGFAAEAMPERLRGLRERIAAAIGAP